MPKTELPQDIFEDEDELALRTFEQNREQMISFHEQLAGLNKENVMPEGIRVEAQQGIREFRKTKLIIEDEIKILSKKGLRASAELDVVVARLSLALYLYNRVEEMYHTVLERNSLSLYALFAPVREEVKKMLSAEFFKKSTKDIIMDYLRIEAMFVACNKVCGLPVLTISDAVKQYKLELRKELIKIMTTGKTKTKSGGR